VRSIYLVILFGIGRNCLRSGRSRSLYLLIRRVITETVVIIKAYRFCQLRAKLYSTSCCQGQLHMQRKLLGLTFIVPCIVIYSYSNNNKMHLFIKLFILVKHSTYFRRSVRPSSGAQNCTYNRHMSKSCCYLLLAGTTWSRVPSRPRLSSC